MVLTKTGWMPLTVMISALEQNSDSDTLSAPSLTTMDGKAAEIWVGEDRAVPKSFSVDADDVNIHIQHKFGNSELMGVHFSVTPEIQKNNLIRLKLNPKIIDLIGYDDYQVSPEANMLMINGGNPIQQIAKGVFPVFNVPGKSTVFDILNASVGNSGGSGNVTTFQDQDRMVDHESRGVPLAAIHGQLPYFRVREVKTQVDVADGSTVGLGGLIYDRLETYKDKVPVLGSIPLIGRLFRSEGERSIKRNLMIFVSAGQIANNGQRKSDVAINN
jgi:type II secretory pathway component GspD/PulD (secretin)